jgi:lysozyme family protein
MDLLDRIIAREGGAKVVNDPVDPGGCTKYGISARAYPNLDIPSLTYEDAKKIYLQDYLIAPGFHQIIDPSVREAVVDFAVHSGVATAVKQLQRLLNLTQDGKCGPATLNAINAMPPDQLKKALIIARCTFLVRQVERTPSKLKFLTGWISRVVSLL